VLCRGICWVRIYCLFRNKSNYYFELFVHQKFQNTVPCLNTVFNLCVRAENSQWSILEKTDI
jgi:hypothetical protein